MWFYEEGTSEHVRLFELINQTWLLNRESVVLNVIFFFFLSILGDQLAHRTENHKGQTRRHVESVLQYGFIGYKNK